MPPREHGRGPCAEREVAGEHAQGTQTSRVWIHGCSTGLRLCSAPVVLQRQARTRYPTPKKNLQRESVAARSSGPIFFPLAFPKHTATLSSGVCTLRPRHHGAGSCRTGAPHTLLPPRRAEAVFSLCRATAGGVSEHGLICIPRRLTARSSFQ